MRAARPVVRALSTLVFASLICASLAGRAAAIVVSPGDSTGPLTATGCTSNSGNLLSIPCARCLANCDLAASNKALAGIIFIVLPPPGKFFAYSAPYVDFSVAGTPSTAGNLLPASIDYDIQWSGLWVLLGVFADVGPPNEVSITLTLQDRTEGDRVVRSERVHEMTPQLTSIELQGIPLDVGGWTDKGRVRNSFVSMVRRGHEYRLVMQLDLKAFSLFNRNTNLDYITGDRGAWWNALSVSVADDPKDLVAHHAHTYLTGRGEGHNNTTATTGLAIFFDDEPPPSRHTDDPPVITDSAIRSRIMPNPLDPNDPRMTIAFSLPEAAHVRIKIFDVSGKDVMTVVDAMRGAGDQTFTIDANSMPAGVYFYRLEAGALLESRKLVVVR